MGPRILVVEDEEAIASFLQTALSREGFQVELVSSGEMAVQKLRSSPVDLVVLDLMLPGIDGLEVCRQIRARSDYVPIVIVTAKDEELDTVVGLELGADEYVTKPFSPRELAARIRAVLRLAKRPNLAPGGMPLVIDAHLNLDIPGRALFVDGHETALTPTEFDLLALLAQRPGVAFSRDSLLREVWGYDYLGDSRTVDVHIQRLRRKIERNPEGHEYILTVRSIGYKFAPAKDDALQDEG